MDMTQQLTPEDMELMAAAQELSAIYKEAGLDINSLTDDQVLELAKIAYEQSSEQLGEEGAPEEGASEPQAEAAEEGKEAEVDEEMMIHLAQADFTGRVIARSMIDELEKAGALEVMQKQAGLDKVAVMMDAAATWLQASPQERMEKTAAVYAAFADAEEQA